MFRRGAGGRSESAPCPVPTGTGPCFYWDSCRRAAEIEKNGKSVCRPCAARLKGVPYPLRGPSSLVSYERWPRDDGLAEQLDMQEMEEKT